MMGSVSGTIWRWGVMTSLTLVATALTAHADVTTERSASILIFPKVLSDSLGLQTGGVPVDTIIQISNKSNQLVFARCFYVNAVPLDPSRPPSLGNPAFWQEVDFEITLTKQQPTHWIVSTGRRIESGDPICSRTVHNCNGAGFDPGAGTSFVPPVGNPFTGELKCIEVDSTGAPLNGNHLKGEATIVSRLTGDASEYNAVGIVGLNTNTGPNDGDNTLCLGGGTSDQCPNGAEYNACPETVILNHFAENATDPVIETLGNGPSRVNTELTLVPCSEDFENQAPLPVVIQFLGFNEFEQSFSTSTTVTCWGNFRLGAFGRIFDISLLGTRFAQTRLTAVDTDMNGTPIPGGFVGVAEEFHQQPGAVSRVALNLHGEGERQSTDLIILPEQ
jgi:hypothetical protein